MRTIILTIMEKVIRNMNKIVLSNELAISLGIEKVKTDDVVLSKFLSESPFHVIILNKNQKELNHLSCLDKISNIKDFKRVYNAKTYILQFINITGNKIEYTNKDYNTIICLSRRFIRSSYKELKLSKASIINEYGERICKEFISKTLPSLLKKEHYQVVLYQNDKPKANENVFYEKKEDVIDYIIQNKYFNEEINKKLLCELK